MVTAGRRRTFMSSAIVSLKGRSVLVVVTNILIAAVSPNNAVETHQETREQSASMHDADENTAANAQEEAVRANADAVAVRVPNLRKVRALTRPAYKGTPLCIPQKHSRIMMTL